MSSSSVNNDSGHFGDDFDDAAHTSQPSNPFKIDFNNLSTHNEDDEVFDNVDESNSSWNVFHPPDECLISSNKQLEDQRLKNKAKVINQPSKLNVDDNTISSHYVSICCINICYPTINSISFIHHTLSYHNIITE